MIETERLVLRGWRPGDHAEFARVTNTPAVMKHLGGVVDPAMFEASEERSIALQAERGHCFWIVERKADGAMLGFCGPKVATLPGTAIDGEIEIGWRLREDAWGQGYAQEAARATLDWVWANLDVPRAIAITIPANLPSQKVMQRIGMIRRPDLDFAHPAFPADHPLSAHLTCVAERPNS